MDLTLHIALLFILGFIFLLSSIYFLKLHLLVEEFRDATNNYSFLLMEIPLTITMLFVSTCTYSMCSGKAPNDSDSQFVMYHAQTIAGGRFAEMRLHDFYLASLILFHDFLLIYWLTFYCQITNKMLSPRQLNPAAWNMPPEITIPDHHGKE